MVVAGILICITVSQRRECFWDLCLYNCVTEKRVLLGSLYNCVTEKRVLLGSLFV